VFWRFRNLSSRVGGVSPLDTTVARYGFAVVVVAVAFGLRLALAPLTGGGAPFALFFVATLVTSLIAGVGPGILTAIVSLPLAARTFAVGAGYPASEAAIEAALYAIDTAIIIYVAAAMMRHRRRLEGANQRLSAATAERERALARERETLDLAPDAYIVADSSTRITDVNQAAVRLIGYERDELVGMRVHELLTDEDRQRVDATGDGRIAQVEKAEWRLRRKDGSTVHVEVSCGTLPDGRWQAFARDISERKRVEDIRQVFVSLLDNSLDYIGVANAEGTPIYLNAAGRRLIGLPDDFPISRLKIEDTFPPELRSFVKNVILRTMQERGSWSGETNLLNLRTQERIPVSDTHFMIRDATGTRVLGHGTVTRDISESRRIAMERETLLRQERRARQEAESANQQLRESEERFRLTIDNAPIGMALVALDGRFVRVNQRLCEITGYSADELEQLTFQDITHPDDVGTDIDAARKLERSEISRYQVEKRYIRKDGSIVDIALGASLLRTPDGRAQGFISQMEDITARKRDEEALQRAVFARDQVLRIVAHDLRNPLHAIMMQSEMLERPAPAPERRDPRPREIISRAAMRMNRLIQDLLDVAQIEAGELKVELEALAPADIARDAVEAQSAVARASGIVLTLEAEPNLPDILGDHDRLLQVLDNLIGNAIKFTNDGGSVTVRVESEEDAVTFSVSDTGCGIAPDDLAHVFDPFWQAATRAKRLGAGLGLPITRGIVEAHHGRIWATSEPERGTTFLFTIPTARAARRIRPSAERDGAAPRLPPRAGDRAPWPRRRTRS
jgi:PAS domain S-box-containing protein